MRFGFFQAAVVSFLIAATLQFNIPAVADHVGSFEVRAFDKSAVDLTSETGKHRFDVEMAVTPAQRLRGLQFRHSLGKGQGMLFDFGRDRDVVMWMKNTEIALDIIFIDSTGTVRHIYQNATPYSLDYIPSTVPVRAVLEVAAGTVGDLKIKPGDQVSHPIFQSGT